MEYACCFCGNAIEQADKAALQLIATNLWSRKTAQSVYAHSACASANMAKGQLSPEELLDGELGFSLEEIVWGEDEGRRLAVKRWSCLGVILAVAILVYLFIRY